MSLFSSNNLSRNDEEEDIETEDTGIDDELLKELEGDDAEDDEEIASEAFPITPLATEDDEEEDEDENGLEDEFLGGKIDEEDEDAEADYDSFDDQDDL